jgi:RHS repeat-associated protein
VNGYKNVTLSSSDQTSVFAYAGQQVISEYAPGDVVMRCDRKYTYGVYVDEMLNYVDASPTDEKSYWLKLNRQYSAYAVADDLGATSVFYGYYPYGRYTSVASDVTYLGHEDLSTRYVTFTGRNLDVESSLLHFRSRQYVGRLGEFASRDRLGYVDGVNLYTAYFAAASLDPYGTKSFCFLKDGPILGTGNKDTYEALGASGGSLTDLVGNPLPASVDEQIASEIVCIRKTSNSVIYQCNCNCWTPAKVAPANTITFTYPMHSDEFKVTVAEADDIWVTNIGIGVPLPPGYPQGAPGPSIEVASGWRDPQSKSHADRVCARANSNITWTGALSWKPPSLFECSVGSAAPSQPF